MLYEKLEFYEVKMIGYNSPSFGPRYSSGNPSHLSNLDYWLEKVWIVENQIRKTEKEIKEFSKFVLELDLIEQQIVTNMIECVPVKDIIKKIHLDRNTYYYYVRKINDRIKRRNCKKRELMI